MSFETRIPEYNPDKNGANSSTANLSRADSVFSVRLLLPTQSFMLHTPSQSLTIKVAVECRPEALATVYSVN